MPKHSTALIAKTEFKQASERQPQLKFNQPSARIIRPRHRDVAEGRARLPEVCRDALRRSVSQRADKEVRDVERIQELRAKIHCVAFADLRAFEQVEVNLIDPRSLQKQPFAEFARHVGRREIRLIRFEIGQRLAASFIGRQRVINDALRQPVNDAVVGLANLDQLLQFAPRDVFQQKTAVLRVQRRASAGDEV